MGYLDSLASILDSCHIHIETSSNFYDFYPPITTSVIRDWCIDTPGILKFEIQTTQDFPQWEDILYNYSYIEIYSSQETKTFCILGFNFLNDTGNKYTIGQTWVIYLTLLSLKIEYFTGGGEVVV